MFSKYPHWLDYLYVRANATKNITAIMPSYNLIKLIRSSMQLLFGYLKWQYESGMKTISLIPPAISK